jgi:hypothetical protein
MKTQNETPLYATLLYEVRKQLDITWIEYVYLDMVYHLSKDGWCYKSLDNCSEDLGIDRSNVYKMRKRLIAKGLLKKNIKGHVKTTVAYAKHIRINNSSYANRQKPYAKRDYSIGETPTKNNNRITIEKGNGLKEKLRAANPSFIRNFINKCLESQTVN